MSGRITDDVCVFWSVHAGELFGDLDANEAACYGMHGSVYQTETIEMPTSA